MVWRKFGSRLPSGQWQFRSVRSGQYQYFGLFGLANTHISVCSVWPIPIFRPVRSGQYPYLGLFRLANTHFLVCLVLFVILPSIKTFIYPIRQNFNILTSLYNLTDHEAIPLSLGSPVTETKPLIQNFKSFRNADYDAINEHLVEKQFQAIFAPTSTKVAKNSQSISTKESGVIDVIVQQGFAKTYNIIICVYYSIYEYYLLSICTKLLLFSWRIWRKSRQWAGAFCIYNCTFTPSLSSSSFRNFNFSFGTPQSSVSLCFITFDFLSVRHPSSTLAGCNVYFDQIIS